MNELFREILDQNEKAVEYKIECRCDQINNIKTWYYCITGNRTIYEIVVHENKEQNLSKKEQNRLQANKNIIFAVIRKR